jgi:hypothetical protein
VRPIASNLSISLAIKEEIDDWYYSSSGVKADFLDSACIAINISNMRSVVEDENHQRPSSFFDSSIS